MDTEQIIRRFCQDIIAFKKGEINAVTLYEMAVGLGEESIIDTACEWLDYHLLDYHLGEQQVSKVIEDFCKAMRQRKTDYERRNKKET